MKYSLEILLLLGLIKLCGAGNGSSQPANDDEFEGKYAPPSLYIDCSWYVPNEEEYKAISAKKAEDDAAWYATKAEKVEAARQEEEQKQKQEEEQKQEVTK